MYAGGEAHQFTLVLSLFENTFRFTQRVVEEFAIENWFNATIFSFECSKMQANSIKSNDTLPSRN